MAKSYGIIIIYDKSHAMDSIQCKGLLKHALQFMWYFIFFQDTTLILGKIDVPIFVDRQCHTILVHYLDARHLQLEVYQKRCHNHCKLQEEILGIEMGIIFFNFNEMHCKVNYNVVQCSFSRFVFKKWLS
jgi:hypothetical protein